MVINRLLSKCTENLVKDVRRLRSDWKFQYVLNWYWKEKYFPLSRMYIKKITDNTSICLRLYQKYFLIQFHLDFRRYKNMATGNKCINYAFHKDTIEVYPAELSLQAVGILVYCTKAPTTKRKLYNKVIHTVSNHRERKFQRKIQPWPCRIHVYYARG